MKECLCYLAVECYNPGIACQPSLLMATKLADTWPEFQQSALHLCVYSNLHVCELAFVTAAGGLVCWD